jgi:hypothetical protein
MNNSSNIGNVSTGIIPVSKVVPVLGVERTGSVTQELASRAKNFIVGQVYQAKVLEKLSDNVHLVNVDKTVLKMNLGDAAKAGQTLPLRFLQLQPVPTFLLEAQAKGSELQTKLSNTGKLLGTFLSQAKAEGATARYQAQGIVSQQPTNPIVLAQDLKQAITKTGLFYESQLGELARGTRGVESLRQEPQNLNQTQLSTLVSQQLSVLETNKLSWNGEIWPGQQMALDVKEVPPERVHEKDQSEQQNADDDVQQMQTDLTLDLPSLGKVKAQLRLVDGKIAIQLAAQNEQTTVLLNQQKNALAKSLEARGQTLDGLSVTHLKDDQLNQQTDIRHVSPA